MGTSMSNSSSEYIYILSLIYLLNSLLKVTVIFFSSPAARFPSLSMVTEKNYDLGFLIFIFVDFWPTLRTVIEIWYISFESVLMKFIYGCDSWMNSSPSTVTKDFWDFFMKEFGRILLLILDVFGAKGSFRPCFDIGILRNMYIIEFKMLSKVQ